MSTTNFVIRQVTIRVECMVRPKKKTPLGSDGNLSRNLFPLREVSQEIQADVGSPATSGTPVLSVTRSTSSQPRDWFRDVNFFPFTLDPALEVVPNSQWIKLRFEVKHDGQTLFDTIGYEIDAAQPDNTFSAAAPQEFTVKQTATGLQFSFPDTPGGGAVTLCTDLETALAAVSPDSWQAALYRAAWNLGNCQ